MASEKIVVLNKDNFENEVSTGDMPVVVDFWAPWCGPCRAVGPIMDELANEYDGKAKICKVNVDEEGELAAKFRVMSIPTIIMYKGGQVVEKVIGARSKDEFSKLLDKNL
ncbi:MAG: thioredoxin [Clostridia bacterium]|nr:thioredoxin [Clostridia bacterium]